MDILGYDSVSQSIMWLLFYVAVMSVVVLVCYFAFTGRDTDANE